MVPGLVAPSTPVNNQAVWGENLIVQVPDPGFDCDIKLLVKAKADQTTADIVVNYARSADNGNINLQIDGPLSKKVLYPGTFFFQCLYIISVDNVPTGYHPGVQGAFELIETAASSYVPALGDAEAEAPDVSSPGFYEDGGYLYTPTGGKIPIIR